MASWLVAQALVTLFFALVDVPSSIKENGTFDLMGLTLAIPLMVVGLVSTAVMRGEMRALWRYTEVWSQKPEEKVAEEEAEVEDEEEGARDEILASYADEKEEVVPEYTAYPVDVKA